MLFLQLLCIFKIAYVPKFLEFNMIDHILQETNLNKTRTKVISSRAIRMYVLKLEFKEIYRYETLL